MSARQGLIDGMVGGNVVGGLVGGNVVGGTVVGGVVGGNVAGGLVGGNVGGQARGSTLRLGGVRVKIISSLRVHIGINVATRIKEHTHTVPTIPHWPM